MPHHVESEDITRLVIQFLRENQLLRTLSTLENESNVTFNTMDTADAIEDLRQDIMEGRLETAWRSIEAMKIPIEKQINLHEQITVEQAERGDMTAAVASLNKSDALQVLKQADPERYIKLERLLASNTFDSKTYYGNSDRRQKRQAIADEIVQDIAPVPPSRLLALLGQHLKWQQQKGELKPGVPFDIIQGKMQEEKAEDDASINKPPYRHIKFPGKKAHAECAMFAPNGKYMATGTVDGFIELWDYTTGKLHKGFKYQAENNLMAMDKAVQCINFNKGSDALVSGSIDGTISVWNVQTGKRRARFSPAHSQGVASVCFNKDGTQVLSGSQDHTIKLHGLKSGMTLKEFRGHTSFVNCVLFTADNKTVLSASSDGTVKVWDTRTTTCRHTITPQPSIDADKNALNPMGGIGGQAVQWIVPFPHRDDQILVCNRSNTLYIMTLRGQIIKTLSHHRKSGADFVAAATSPQGEYVYGLTEKSVLYCFRTMTGKLVGEQKVNAEMTGTGLQPREAEAIGITGHPFSNVVASFDDKGYVYFLRA